MARKWIVEGFKPVSYQSKKTGRQVEGVSIYLSSDPITPDITGKEVKEIYLSKQASAYSPAIGDQVNVFYNDRGYIDDVVPVI